MTGPGNDRDQAEPGDQDRTEPGRAGDQDGAGSDETGAGETRTTATGVAAGGHGRAARHSPHLDELVREVEAAEHEYRPPAAGVLSNAVTAVVVIALGLAGVFGSLALGVGEAAEPGPGTWPLLVSAVLTVLGVVLLAIIRRTSDAERFTSTSWLVLAAVATMVVFVLVIEVVGFEIPAALLCFVWLRFLGGESWRLSVITSLAVVAGFYLLFVAALAVPIPHLF